jgi:hypothetical protein
MLLNRLFKNVKSQNWVGLWLELLVVIVGIFLAIQVDRWYEAERRASEESELLLALAEDFSASRVRLESVISRHSAAAESALKLLQAEADGPNSISYDEFYTHLSHVQWTITPNVARRTYDLLIASGDINTIRDASLKAEMAAFFAVFDGRGSFVAVELRDFSSNIWLPYLNSHLDHVALMQKVHADDTAFLTPTQSKDQYREVLGSPQFEGVIMAKWHLSRDYVFNLQRMLDSVDQIQGLLTQNL